jgi:hypothetical protein
MNMSVVSLDKQNIMLILNLWLGMSLATAKKHSKDMLPAVSEASTFMSGVIHSVIKPHIHRTHSILSGPKASHNRIYMFCLKVVKVAALLVCFGIATSACWLGVGPRYGGERREERRDHHEERHEEHHDHDRGR